jgi:hypothetical protein
MSDTSAKKSSTDSPSVGTPQSGNAGPGTANTPPFDSKPSTGTNGVSNAVGSPFKKQRPSLPGLDGAMLASLDDVTASNNVAPQSQASNAAQAPVQATMDEDEEL